MAEIKRPHPACSNVGFCQAPGLMHMMDQAAQAVRQTGRTGMSQAMWCDHGGHAFSERDPGRQRITIRTLNEETDQEEDVFKDFCGECAVVTGMTKKGKTRTAVPELTASAQAAATAEKADDHFVLRDLQQKYEDMRAQLAAQQRPVVDAEVIDG